MAPTADYYNGLNTKLLAAIPADARRVLELGCANGLLGRAFKASHPQAYWCGIDRCAEAVESARQHLDSVHRLDLDADALTGVGTGYDVIVIGDLIEHLRDSRPVLEALYELSIAQARIVCCIPNTTHLSVLERLVGGDFSYDDAGLLDRTHVQLYSQASAFKAFLDAGWLPHLHDTYATQLPANDLTHHLLAAAQAMGVPAATAARNLSMYQMILVCPKWQMQSLRVAGAAVPFSVIAPVNRRWQHQLNVARSPGLQEVGAEVIVVENAPDAASAFATGSARARHAWRVMVHQDVYFPTGTGHALARQLGAIERAGLTQSPVGFAGVDAGPDGHGGVRYAGLVIDRVSLFDHGASDGAVSIDELAVAVHRDCSLAIDPALGWHLWATDLCLQAMRRHGRPTARIVQVPLFHNSVCPNTLPEAFHDSGLALLSKYPDHDRILTLCGELSRTSAVPVPQPPPASARPASTAVLHAVLPAPSAPPPATSVRAAPAAPVAAAQVKAAAVVPAGTPAFDPWRHLQPVSLHQ